MTSVNVCLVIPPSVFLLDERVFATLGVLRIASVLEEKGVDVSVLDLSGIANFTDVVRLHAEETPPLVYGITATTPQLPAARAIARAIRECAPETRIMMGGPHTTLTHSAALREGKRGTPGRAHKALAVLQDMADVLVAGDGEFAIFDALRAPRGTIINADDPSSSLFLSNADLNVLPLPARHLIDLSSYHYQIEGVPATSLIAQLGCPFACGFCGGRLSPSLRHIRTRSVEHVVGEMKTLHETYGFCGFMLYDDELNVNREMVRLMREIHRAQEEIGVEWQLRGFVKSQLFTNEQAEAMRHAGFRWVLVGFESGSERILTNINKRATRDENTRCVEIARRHGLRVKALMSLGHPGESRETIDETRKWLLATAPDDFDATIITTYPGTPYYDDAIPDPSHPGEWIYTYAKTGDRLHAVEVDYSEVADYYKGDPEGGYRSYVYTDSLSLTGLVEERDALEQDVREKLGIPWNPSAPARSFEHSMGQLPHHILRSTKRGL